MRTSAHRVCLAIAIIIAIHSSADSPTRAGYVSEPRVFSEAAEGNNWLLNGRTFDAQHFSPLKEINRTGGGSTCIRGRRKTMDRSQLVAYEL